MGTSRTFTRSERLALVRIVNSVRLRLPQATLCPTALSLLWAPEESYDKGDDTWFSPYDPLTVYISPAVKDKLHEAVPEVCAALWLAREKAHTHPLWWKIKTSPRLFRFFEGAQLDALQKQATVLAASMLSQIPLAPRKKIVFRRADDEAGA
jgi:hypothetical protein